MAKVAEASSIVNLSFLGAVSMGCLKGFSYYTELIAKTLAPLAISGALALAFILVYIRNKALSVPKQKAILLQNKILQAFLVLTYTVLPGVSSSIFQAFPCDTLDDGTSWLMADYSLSCDTPMHKLMVLYSLAMTVVYPIGVPVLYSTVLARNSHKLNPAAGKKFPPHISLAAREQNAIELEGMSFLYKQYRPSMWWYELFETARRLAGTVSQISLALLLRGHELYFLYKLAVYCLSASGLTACKPFLDSQANDLGFASLMLNYLTLFGALFIKIDIFKESRASSARLVMSIVLVTLNMCVVSMAVRMLLKIRAAVRSTSLQQSAYTLLNSMSPKNWGSSSPSSSQHPKRRPQKKWIPDDKGMMVVDDSNSGELNTGTEVMTPSAPNTPLTEYGVKGQIL
eukprot:18957-Heterococcus_DN1.PRE.2